MKKFRLTSSFRPSGDQPEAIRQLTDNIGKGEKEQVLLGVTGSGKTFTMAHVVQNIQKPTLVISHNKTLAAQLYQEFRDFFPDNAVSYFVSYYDYYQPEAYVPQSDTYIEKETQINEEIDKLRLAATTNLLTRNDVIIVASVSCIYNIGSPREYGHFVLELASGMSITRKSIMQRLIQLQYERNDIGFRRGTFRVRGDTIDIFPAYLDTSVRLVLNTDTLRSIETVNPLTGHVSGVLQKTMVYPAKHFMTDPSKNKNVFQHILSDLEKQKHILKQQGKLIEAQRIEQRVRYDLEMIEEMGYVNGIENYSRYFDGRKPGDPPYTLFDYFEEAVCSSLPARLDSAKRAGKAGFALERGGEWLLIIDESHMTIPQIRGMYNGDRSRKQTLVDYGFRLPSALDNRPLRFEEFLRRTPQTIYVSATPSEWETSRSVIVEQLVRPTGLVDPSVSIRPIQSQIDDLVREILSRVEKKERVLVTTLTKRMAEDLSHYLENKNIRVHYLHADIETLKRMDILADLRLGKFDVIVGINLLREGLDLPEVSLVVILDADKEGFLRNKTSLIQTMGRAARHIRGEVILYADNMTDSIKNAVEEVKRRRNVQLEYNRVHHISPASIAKPLRKKLVEKSENPSTSSSAEFTDLLPRDVQSLTPLDRSKLIKKITKEMHRASKNLLFERAAELRDLLSNLP